MVTKFTHPFILVYFNVLNYIFLVKIASPMKNKVFHQIKDCILWKDYQERTIWQLQTQLNNQTLFIGELQQYFTTTFFNF